MISSTSFEDLPLFAKAKDWQNLSGLIVFQKHHRGAVETTLVPIAQPRTRNHPKVALPAMFLMVPAVKATSTHLRTKELQVSALLDRANPQHLQHNQRWSLGFLRAIVRREELAQVFQQETGRTAHQARQDRAKTLHKRMGHTWVTIGLGVSQQSAGVREWSVRAQDLTTAERVPLSTLYSSSWINSKNSKQSRPAKAWNQQWTHICLVKTTNKSL